MDWWTTSVGSAAMPKSRLDRLHGGSTQAVDIESNGTVVHIAYRGCGPVLNDVAG